MANIHWLRAGRFLSSCTSVDIIGAGTLAAATVGAAISATGAMPHDTAPAWFLARVIWASSGWLVAIGCIILLLLIARAWGEYKRRTFDPTWALKFSDMFNSTEIKRIRAGAVKEFQEHGAYFTNLETPFPFAGEVLSFFDHIGFYVQGHQLSPEVAHQHFFYWLQSYRQIFQYHIAATREDDPNCWEYVESLYKLTLSIECERSKEQAPAKLSPDRIARFLKEERKLSDSTH